MKKILFWVIFISAVLVYFAPFEVDISVGRGSHES